MKKINILSMALLTAMFAGCQQEDINGDYGYLQLSSVNVDKNIKTKAGDALSLDLCDASGKLLKHADDWTTIQSESLLLPVGTYTLKGYSATGSAQAQGFDAAPYYAGQTEVSVEKGIAKTATVSCGLAQAKIQVSYSDKFKSVFSTYSTSMTNTQGTINFVQTETRQAFVCAGESLDFTLSMAKDGSAAKTYKHQIATVEPKCLYKVNYDINDVPGSADFTVTVNIQVDRYEINSTVPLQSDICIDLQAKSADAWGQFAYLYGTSTLVSATDSYEFQYKQSSASAWTTVSAEFVNGQYKAKTGKLDFNTSYDYRLKCGAKMGAVSTFFTEKYEEIPNLNFDTWTQSGKNWFANADAADSYWATGNTGVTSFLAGSREPVTVAVDMPDARTGKAAKMSTITGVTLVGAAAGNLFIGSYKTDMSRPENSVKFGRSYTGARPVALSGYYKYEGKAINHGTFPGTLTKDEGHIYIQVWDAGNNSIGYGELVITEDATTYQPFTIEIKYTDATAKPAKIAIVTTSSHYGGHFDDAGTKVTGQVGAGSTLWVDDFSISYYKE